MCKFEIVVCASANPPAAITHNRTCAFPPANPQSKERVLNSHFSFFSSTTSGENSFLDLRVLSSRSLSSLAGNAGKNRGKNTHILIHAIVATSQTFGRPDLDGPEDTCTYYSTQRCEYMVLDDAKNMWFIRGGKCVKTYQRKRTYNSTKFCIFQIRFLALF